MAASQVLVRMVKVTCAGLAMVTSLSWMANARTSSFIVRDSGRDLERINVTFRWIKQHAFSCPLLNAGVACCLPTCAQGSSVPNTGNLGFGLFWAFGFLLCVLCIWGVLVLLVPPCCVQVLGLLRCASCWTRPLGGGRWGHYLCNLWEEHTKSS